MRASDSIEEPSGESREGEQTGVSAGARESKFESESESSESKKEGKERKEGGDGQLRPPSLPSRSLPPFLNSPH